VGLPSVVGYIQGLLNGLAMPFPTVELAAYITPPDPNVETVIMPTLYVLTADGPEKRLTMPRNTGPGTTAGEKTLTHTLELHVVWMIANSNPAAPGAADPDLLFSGVIEGIMQALRTSPAPVLITDPWTGQQTELVDTGENMTYRYLPRHSIKNQRMLRYDALITLPLLELIEA
jgi:hypothetical protein